VTDLDPTEPSPPKRPAAPAAPPVAPADGAFGRAEQKTMLVPRRERDSNLPPGHLLQEFRLERVLGVGSYSIVYLAHDTKLDRRVAIKEYLPATLAARARRRGRAAAAAVRRELRQGHVQLHQRGAAAGRP
jgi:serine/threonine protein kinase